MIARFSRLRADHGLQRYLMGAALLWLGIIALGAALPQKLGDVDGDGQLTVLDIVQIINHLNRSVPLSNDLAIFADVNQDGFVNEADAAVVANAILGLTSFPDLPLARIRETSPANRESNVAVTRETVLRFTLPLSATTVLSTNRLYAEFGGRRLLSRVELSSDRNTATLFYLEHLPGSARIRVTFNGDGLTDFLGRPVDASGGGVVGGTTTIDFDTLSLTPLAHTAVIGRVFASELATGPGSITNSVNRPLAGVTITVDGMEETLRTVTDAMGNFKLEPAPAGRFFVLVDGRTATNGVPQGAYYPFVGKAWEAAAGRTDNLAGGTGEIFLPLITAGTLQAVSPTTDTSITFPAAVISKNPALAGVSISVPANALFSENGTRGGKVGIAPVPPDRLPEPLPGGLNFPLVITIQTDGPGNFDRPVPVRFPNLADPVTGKKLAPGSKSALWSFNHDTGRWEIQGPMTVSTDGLFVESDPGVGVRQPGWHGTQPGSQGKGGPIEGTDGSGSGDGGGAPDGPRRPPRTPPPPPPRPPGDPPKPNCMVEIQEPRERERFYETKPVSFRANGSPKPGEMEWFFEQALGFSPRPDIGQGDSVDIQFFLQYGTSVRTSLARAKWKPGGCEEFRYFDIIPTTKAEWADEFPGSNSPDDLVEPFRANVQNFLSALFIASLDFPQAELTWEISSTLRPAKRAYLMHHAARLAVLDEDFVSVPSFNPGSVATGIDPYTGRLDIGWAHYDANGDLDLEESTAAVLAMVSAYGIVYPPALLSRHTRGLAMDIKITWKESFNVRLPGGTFFFIPKNPGNGADSQDLWSVGAAYGVVKLRSDPPHWSNDGH